jgi:hypothetical protein
MKLTETLKKDKMYPLIDYHPDKKWSHSTGIVTGNVMAMYSGEKRCPKKDEWYLSGAIIAAYKAPHDSSTPYHIAVLVKITDVRIKETVVYEKIGG